MKIAPADAYFAGHFPGQPILPGVTQIALAAEAIRREITATTLCAVRHARLRQLVGPDEQLELTSRTVNESVRFDLRRGGQVVTNGELVFGTLAPEEGSEAPVFGPALSHPPIAQLLPHRPPMLFVQRVLAMDDNLIACEAVLPVDCPLAEAGTAPALAAVEAAAQAAATWEALRRRTDTAEPSGGRIGYLVSLREVTFAQARMPVERPFLVVVRLQSRVLPLSTYAVEVFHDSRPVLRGEIGTFLASGA